MVEKIDSSKVLFLDIETVPQFPTYNDVPPRLHELWKKKSDSLKSDSEKDAESLYERAGIYAEFGKIICISVGMIIFKDTQPYFKVKSFAGDDERVLLQEFVTMLDKSQDKNLILCGHNIKEFDVPYICRRLLINGLHLPALLDIAGKKPWEVNFLDTMELWKFGDYKSYTSLDLLTAVFNIPTPKDDINGSQVAQVYYLEKDLDRIVIYCEKDVLATAQLFRRFRNEPLIPLDNMLR